MKKWKREQKAHDDKHQTILAPDRIAGAKLREKPKVNFIITHKGLYRCPFCLYQATIERFLISTKKGFHKGLAKCRECGNQMRFSSLTAKWTPEQFAEWCHGYAADGYWQKVPWTKFQDRLKHLGIAQKFWQRYKELKGEDKTESYEEWVIRQDREAYEQDMAGEE